MKKLCPKCGSDKIRKREIIIRNVIYEQSSNGEWIRNPNDKEDNDGLDDINEEFKCSNCGSIYHSEKYLKTPDKVN